MQLFIKLIAILGCVATAIAADAAPVRVELYYESQWPACQSFTTGPLKDVLAKQDMADIIDLKLVCTHVS